MTNLFNLRPYQLDAVSQIESCWSKGIQCVVCQLPTGGGKSRIIRQITDNYAANKKVIYLVAHRNTLVRQLSQEIAEADIKHGIIQAGSPFIRYRIQVCSMQTLVRRLDKLAEPEIVIIDECFPAGTIVDGAGPIESIDIGDTVTSYDERTNRVVTSKVTAVMSHVHTGDLIQIYSCGKIITCTRNHPILTRNGWKNAEDIGVQDELLHDLWKTNTRKQKDLLKGMPEQIKLNSYVENKSDICIGQADEKQCYVDTRCQGEGKSIAHRHGPQATDTGREWKKATRPCSQITKCSEQEISREVRSGVCGPNKNGEVQRLPNLLQDGSRLPIVDAINRSGWGQSQLLKNQRKGHEENCSLGFLRVDGTQVLEQGSFEWLRAMHGSDRVYNIEVEWTNTYLVDGIVVHNCHHARSASYVNILNHWPNAKVLGMTATPSRPDGKGLDDIFDRLILGPTMKELIDAGFLSDYEYFAPAVLDMEGVKVKAGEYNTEQTLERVDRKTITGSAVEHYRKYANHMPAIASCVSIAHSEHVAQEFRDAGYKALAVNSTMDALDVQRAIGGLRDGSIEILTQCEMLGEGVDVPAATCLIGLRPTASLVIFLQHVGRVLRKSPGKDKAIILDHVGNWSRFGLPDDDREWTLEGKPKGVKDISKYKRCPDCLHPVLTSARVCPHCGFQWTETAEPMSRVPLEVEGELVSIRDAGDEVTQDLARAISRKAHNLKQAIAIGKSMGIKHTSVYHVWTKVLHLSVDSVI